MRLNIQKRRKGYAMVTTIFTLLIITLFSLSIMMMIKLQTYNLKLEQALVEKNLYIDQIGEKFLSGEFEAEEYGDKYAPYDDDYDVMLEPLKKGGTKMTVKLANSSTIVLVVEKDVAGNVIVWNTTSIEPSKPEVTV